MMLLEIDFSVWVATMSVRSLYHFLETPNKYFCPPDKATA